MYLVLFQRYHKETAIYRNSIVKYHISNVNISIKKHLIVELGGSGGRSPPAPQAPKNFWEIAIKTPPLRFGKKRVKGPPVTHAYFKVTL